MTARDEIAQLLQASNIRVAFPDACQAEVDRILASPDIDSADLEDYRSLPFITIDNPDSTDLDQALAIEQYGDTYAVHYALADASHYIRPGSALFKEGLTRGASYYLPEQSIPMLPRALSEGIISLNPNEDRRAMVFTITLDSDGRPLTTKLVRATIHSQAKLSYEGVQQYHDDPSTSALTDNQYTETLNLLKTVGELRLALFRARHVVEYDRQEVQLTYRDDDLYFACPERPLSERWNEQISLLCNTEGAKLLLGSEANHPHLQAIFRVHEEPTDPQLNSLASIIENVITAHKLDHERWSWRRKEKEWLADYLARLPNDEANQGVRAVIQRQALLTNRAAVFSGERGPHHALKVTAYARFSSPMREIAGIFTHKEALEQLGIIPPQQTTKQDLKLRDEVIESANRSRSTQRKLTKQVYQILLDQIFSRDMVLDEDRRPWKSGIILGLSRSRIYIRLDRPGLELKVYVRDLEEITGQVFTLNKSKTDISSTSGNHYRIGDSVRLSVLRQDPESKRWVLKID